MEQDVTKNMLFGVPLYQKMLPKYFENKTSIIERLYEISKTDEGVTRSNAGGYHSKDNLHLDECEELRWLCQRIVDVSAGCIADYKGGKLEEDLHMVASWVNINQQGQWNTPHTHMPCEWSGAFYVQVNDDAAIHNDGNFIAIDPFPIGPKFKQNTNVMIKPKTGMMLLFPSYLIHMVEPHKEEQDRISIAYNFKLMPKKQQDSLRNDPNPTKD